MGCGRSPRCVVCAGVAKGTLIAIEGIDGTGKGTQARLLLRALRGRGTRAEMFSFPRYGRTASAELLAAYLDGRLGRLDPRVVAVLFACDRAESLASMKAALAKGAVVICDRYVPSNLAHQVARAAPHERSRLRRWIRDLEYRRLGLPRADAVVFLDMPAQSARRRVRKKPRRAYTSRALDVQERDLAHLSRSLAEYRRQASDPSWVRVPTLDARGGPRDRAEIHREIVAALARRGLFRANPLRSA